MKREPLNDTKDALLAFLGGLRPEDRLALVSFADEDRIEAPYGISAARARRHSLEQL